MHIRAHGVAALEIVEVPAADRLMLLLSPSPAHDGIVLPSEVRFLPFGEIRLLTLSACQGSRGNVQRGEPSESLRRAFHLAGVRSVLAAHWRVDSRPTANLMKDFYKEVSMGISLDEALRDAQNRARLTGALPAHWAGWMLSGDPSRVSIRPRR